MKTRDENDSVCPRCDLRLIPVFARKDVKREPIGRCCPEPYWDYFQPKAVAPRFEWPDVPIVSRAG